jgi:hypothetical protein
VIHCKKGCHIADIFLIKVEKLYTAKNALSQESKMKLDTSFLERCINSLEKAYSLLTTTDPDDIKYDIYRSACEKNLNLF